MASDTQIILHSVKGSYLECDEIDANFASLKTTADNSKDIADANKVKLDTVEDNSTADQTDSEIKTAYENNSDTNALTDALKSKLDSVEASATTDQTGAEIKTAYELEPDTNVFTDVEKTNLASAKTSTDDLTYIVNATGYNRRDKDTFPVVELCRDASTGYVRLETDGSVTPFPVATTFGDGTTALVSMTMAVSPDFGNSKTEFSYYDQGVKYAKTAIDTIAIPDVVGGVLLAYTGTTLALETIITEATFDKVWTARIYCDGSGNLNGFAGELHGILEPSSLHYREHISTGAKFGRGLELTGLVNTQTTFTGMAEGFGFDEDIQITVGALATMAFCWKEGNAWKWSDENDAVGHMFANGHIAWNEETAPDVWQLVESTASTDFIVHFVYLTNDAEKKAIKIIGQNAYPNSTDARNAIGDELTRLELFGLPQSEFILVGAYIAKQAGALKDLPDGSLYLDLRGERKFAKI